MPLECDDYSNYISDFERANDRTNSRTSDRKRDRFFQLTQIVRSLSDTDGDWVECGAWRGLSSLLICTYIAKSDSSFRGAGVVVVDSFEGLSDPGGADGDRAKPREFSADLGTVKDHLDQFPEVEFIKGWIPDVLAAIPRRPVKFLHLDLDLYEPTYAALSHFRSMIVPQGVVVVDDYGHPDWPGVTKAVDEFSRQHNLQPIRLISNQALFLSM